MTTRREPGSRAHLGPALKIAIVKLSSLGDVIHALPVARALRRALPGAHLTWIVEAREYALLRDHPDLDAVVPVDTRLLAAAHLAAGRGPPGPGQGAGGSSSGSGAARFDVAIDLQGLIKSGLLTAYTGAPLRIGFTAGRCRERCNCALHQPARDARPRARPRGRAVPVAARAARHRARARSSSTCPSPPRRSARMEEFLGEQGVKRRDRAGRDQPGRRARRQAVAGGALRAPWPSGWPRRRARASCCSGARTRRTWRAQIRRRPAARALLAPPTDLRRAAARCCAAAALMVANDTGPLHLAAALGTPCLGLYGPTRAERNGPYGPRCRGAAESGRHHGRARGRRSRSRPRGPPRARSAP